MRFLIRLIFVIRVFYCVYAARAAKTTSETRVPSALSSAPKSRLPFLTRHRAHHARVASRQRRATRHRANRARVFIRARVRAAAPRARARDASSVVPLERIAKRVFIARCRRRSALARRLDRRRVRLRRPRCAVRDLGRVRGRGAKRERSGQSHEHGDGERTRATATGPGRHARRCARWACPKARGCI